MSQTKKFIFNVKGMHCKSCTILIEEDLGAVAGIRNVKASLDDNSVQLETDNDIEPKLLAKELTEYIKQNGYILEPRV